MAFLRMTFACLALAVAATGAGAQSSPSVVAQARQYLDKKPSAWGRVGLAEILRSHGFKQASIEELQKAARALKPGEPFAVEVQTLLCWRMLPVPAAQCADFRAAVAKLKALQPDDPWASVFDWYVLAGEGNRPALLAALKKKVTPPERCPLAFAEYGHYQLLQECNWTKLNAGMEVIASRAHDPLHALKELDRVFTREADFLQQAGNDADAAQVRTVRDRYREAYSRGARHVVEKLFALHLLGQTKERDGLLARAQALPYLHDRQRLANLLERLDDDEACANIIDPLLTSELGLIDHPPDLSKLELRATVSLRIEYGEKKAQGATTHYDNGTAFKLGSLGVTCDQLTVLHQDTPAAVVVTGQGKVEMRGMPGYAGGITADRFTWQDGTGAFTLSGAVRLHTPGKIIKLRACTLTAQGEVRDAKSWLDDFHHAFSIDAKLALLPKIQAVYTEDELPDEVRYVLALHTLRPHLSWHAPYLPPLPQRERAMRKAEREDFFDNAWQEAFGGEAWMLADIPQAAKDAFNDATQAWYKKYAEQPRFKNVAPPNLPLAVPENYFWRIRDPRHADIARVLRLLQGMLSNEYQGKARRWVAEIRRNNTVLTFDIAGAALKGKTHSLLMDARNADKVAFKLYRVHKPEELLYAANRIGTDFLYRDYHLDEEFMRELDRLKILEARRARDVSKTQMKIEPAPVWKAGQLVQRWEVRVGDLKTFQGESRRHWRRHWRDEDWYDDADADYFDDGCSLQRGRIDKIYRPLDEMQLSSWQCDRIVQIPEKLLTEPGAYVLVAESNGQAAHVPILVDPLSLTLRRCRDGVFVLAADGTGKKPLPGATVHAHGQLGAAATEKEGVAFARVFAAGDRPIVVHHEGRYAIGGFGQLFEGMYDAADDDHGRLMEAMKRARRADRRADEGEAAVYADRHVVIAYTDRPTYRPGQDVQFKLIVRKQVAAKPGQELPLAFRAEEFDQGLKLVLPGLDKDVRYEVVDPKGQEVARGMLKLSEFGTAAGKLALNSETALGAYSVRVHIAGEPRLVPEVFAVQHYRRPNFEVEVEGVPALLKKPRDLTLKIASKYYFGPPVADGRVEVRIHRAGFGRTVAHAEDKLDAKGQATCTLPLPAALEGGQYRVVCSVTDASGRTVSKALALEIEAQGAAKGASGLAKLPRFVPVGKALDFTTSAKEIRIEQPKDASYERKIVPKDGKASITFAEAGWYYLRAGEEETKIFAYGGAKHPLAYRLSRQEEKDEEPELRTARWVNLSDFTWEEQGQPSRWEKPSYHLYALFDRQQASAGDKIKLLVYVPYERAKLLFTLEGRTVLDYVVTWTAAKGGAYQVVEIPLQKRYAPNVYLQGRILAFEGAQAELSVLKDRLKPAERLEEDDGCDPRWCRIDVVTPKPGQGAGGLKVEIETDRAQYRPGDAVRAKVKVTDDKGQPQSAELSFAAVDARVFAFGEDGLERLPGFFRSPQEPRRFLAKVWRTSLGNRWSKKPLATIIKQAQHKLAEMATKAAEAMHKRAEVVPAPSPEQQWTALPLPRLGGEMPVGKIPLARLRAHFHETATWLPQLRTDANGVAQVAFTLPDSLTRYRLTALALTKTTEVGVGRGQFTAGLPLAVQIFLPRFAVEKDRLQAIALIHNQSDQPRECRVEWQVQGALADVPKPGRVLVPAKGTMKATLWLKLEQVGTAKITFKAADEKDADAETRTLPIEPLGQPREFNANVALAADGAGKFNKQAQIDLPKGFLARELSIHIASSELVQALEGLDYLIDYPHGCIEQTMSRFLPAVMVKHATQRTPAVTLRPEIAAKLPDVLAKGLQRVYNFQHEDGSWGWFAKDTQNNPMTVYVVYGLARCQATGTPVDRAVLERGCNYLQGELKANHLDPELAARAWYALALAGHADTQAFEDYARKVLAKTPSAKTRCNLALACKALGLAELGERLWAGVRTMSDPGQTEWYALKLNTQIAYGAKYADCANSVRELLALRQGAPWYHTRDTSWALEALANMLAYVPEKATVRRLQVTLEGKTILDLSDPTELKKRSHRIRMTANELPHKEALSLRVLADSDAMIFVAVNASGVQRRDEIKPSGTRIKLERVIETLDGAPLNGSLKVGQAVRVRLRLHLEQAESHLLIEERRPTSCEFADDHIDGTAARWSAHQEFRDDRLCVYFSSLAAGTHEITYYLRAETPGHCTQLTGSANPMYDAKIRGETGASKIEVR